MILHPGFGSYSNDRCLGSCWNFLSSEFSRSVSKSGLQPPCARLPACSPAKSTIDKIYCQWEKSNNANGQVAHLNYKSRLIVGYLAIISILSSEAKIKSKKKQTFLQSKVSCLWTTEASGFFLRSVKSEGWTDLNLYCIFGNGPDCLDKNHCPIYTLICLNSAPPLYRWWWREIRTLSNGCWHAFISLTK